MTDLELEYSPSSRVGGSAQPFIDDYERRSADAAAALGPQVRRFDTGTLAVAAEPDAPLLVFVHGGYWQALSAAASLYLAPAAAAGGWSYAALEYTLAPSATLGTMVDECRAALAEVAATVPHSRLVLAGHSAGAHLAAMVTVAHEPPVTVDALVLLSGVYDLRPLVHTSVNAPLGLDTAAAETVSPLLLPVANVPTTLVAVGENETDAFHAQSHLLAARLRTAASAASVSEAVVASRHHFDIVDDLVDPSTMVGAFVRGGHR